MFFYFFFPGQKDKRNVFISFPSAAVIIRKLLLTPPPPWQEIDGKIKVVVATPARSSRN